MKPILKFGDQVGIIACSDGRASDLAPYYQKLDDVLIKLGLTPVYVNCLYKIDNTPFSGSPKKRATELIRLFVNPDIKAIFDISGGDTANQILPFLDYKAIQNNPKPFFGISDLSVLLNAFYTRSHLVTYHFQIATITANLQQQILFKQLFFRDTPSFLSYHFSFLRGETLKGIVIGGNIRCFLKLAGTTYMPDPTGKVLFLESLGGGIARITSLLSQLDQMNFFSKCSGILLGSFTQAEKEGLKPTIEEFVLEMTHPYNLPIVKTSQLGHGLNAHCIPIGQFIELRSSH